MDGEEDTRCKAVTKSGTRCKNMAMMHSDYCHTHASLAQNAARATRADAVTLTPAASPPSMEVSAGSVPEPPRNEVVMRVGGIQLTTDVGLDLLMHEVEQLAIELQRRFPTVITEPITPSTLVGYFNRSVGKYLPETPRELLKDVERNLEEATFRDFADPETWQGLWAMVNYTIQGQLAVTQQATSERLAAVLGMEVVVQIRASLEGATVQDAVDPGAWKELLTGVVRTLQPRGQLPQQAATDEAADESGEQGTAPTANPTVNPTESSH